MHLHLLERDGVVALKCASRNPAHFLGSWAFPSPTKPQYSVPCWAKAHLLAEKKLKAVEPGPALLGCIRHLVSWHHSTAGEAAFFDLRIIPDMSVLLGA